jgi:hypothetical protein
MASDAPNRIIENSPPYVYRQVGKARTSFPARERTGNRLAAQASRTDFSRTT